MAEEVKVPPKVEPVQSVEPVVPPVEEPAKKKPASPLSHKKLIFSGLALILLVGAIAYLFGFKQAQEKLFTQDLPEPSPVPAISPKPMLSIPTGSLTLLDKTINWQTPEELADLGFFISRGEDSEMKAAHYYKVGSFPNGEDLILVVLVKVGMGEWEELHRFVKQGEDYFRLVQNSAEIDTSFDPGYDLGSFKDDVNLILPELLPEETIEYGKSTLMIRQNWNSYEPLGEVPANTRKVGSSEWGDVFMTTVDTIPGSESQAEYAKYYIELKDLTKVHYQPKPKFMGDDGSFFINWDDHEKNREKKFSFMRTGGCGLGLGSFPFLATGKELPGSKKQVGNHLQETPIYTLTNTNDALVKFGYDVYTMDQIGEKKPIETFVDDLGLLFWTDDFGSTLIFVNNEYLPMVECAKPVIYLYPERVEAVKVQVGAKITESEPEYDNGWRVIAYPNGNLLVDGEEYSSLFWDGLGYGDYPEVKEGVIVEKDKVEDKIRSQLTQVGLKENEISDFLEFWLPKMPGNPYVRLSWLLNQEMNQLAPLRIKPFPETLIRVFLDFEGLDKKEAIRPQVLERIERKGFTVVEWGGLLIGE